MSYKGPKQGGWSPNTHTSKVMGQCHPPREITTDQIHESSRQSRPVITIVLRNCGGDDTTVSMQSQDGILSSIRQAMDLLIFDELVLCYGGDQLTDDTVTFSQLGIEDNAVLTVSTSLWLDTVDPDLLSVALHDARARGLSTTQTASWFPTMGSAKPVAIVEHCWEAAALHGLAGIEQLAGKGTDAAYVSQLLWQQQIVPVVVEVMDLASGNAQVQQRGCQALAALYKHVDDDVRCSDLYSPVLSTSAAIRAIKSHSSQETTLSALHLLTVLSDAVQSEGEALLWQSVVTTVVGVLYSFLPDDQIQLAGCRVLLSLLKMSARQDERHRDNHISSAVISAHTASGAFEVLVRAVRSNNRAVASTAVLTTTALLQRSGAVLPTSMGGTALHPASLEDALSAGVPEILMDLAVQGLPPTRTPIHGGRNDPSSSQMSGLSEEGSEVLDDGGEAITDEMAVTACCVALGSLAHSPEPEVAASACAAAAKLEYTLRRCSEATAHILARHIVESMPAALLSHPVQTVGDAVTALGAVAIDYPDLVRETLQATTIHGVPGVTVVLDVLRQYPEHSAVRRCSHSLRTFVVPARAASAPAIVSAPTPPTVNLVSQFRQTWSPTRIAGFSHNHPLSETNLKPPEPPVRFADKWTAGGGLGTHLAENDAGCKIYHREQMQSNVLRSVSDQEDWSDWDRDSDYDD